MKVTQKMMLRALSIKHLLVLSLALNVGLFLRLCCDGEQRVCECSCLENKERSEATGFIAEDADKEAQVSKRMHLVLASSASSSTSTSSLGVRAKDNGRSIINLDHGDPTMYEGYWQKMGDKTTIVISGWQTISYFSDVRNLCWFLEPEFSSAVIRLHKLVGNAITKDRYIVVGTGSSQLFQAVLYALCPPDLSEPMSVVSAAPFYSSYPAMTDFLKSGLYQWAGDAYKYDKDKPYIELVTSPNNPDGSIRQAVVNRSEGILIHDLAYYWPQYTPITSPADHDIMLFTVSKSTGHAGSRIGWALVKDEEIAKKMTKYIEINTIGVSKDSQLRAAKILDVISDSYDHKGNFEEESNFFFEYGYNHMARRWKQLREAVDKGNLFSLPDFASAKCTFSGRNFEPRPAFAWLKCEGEIKDCEKFLKDHNIITRSGQQFGVSPKYVRISMLDRDEKFDKFTERLSIINSINSP